MTDDVKERVVCAVIAATSRVSTGRIRDRLCGIKFHITVNLHRLFRYRNLEVDLNPRSTGRAEE
eukprot:scaffold2072_cov162-Amphora_coffeaeformis.AAC.10